jgi:2-polyprenyl-6-methoxyphenol hydroxylase-like FAD-dependent oxidoreductase
MWQPRISSRRSRIAVIGLGIAGAAVAVMLGRRGHAVRCYERADAAGHAGAGLLLSPAGQQVLDALGLLPAARELGAPVQCFRTLDACGRIRLELDYAQWRAGASALGLQRLTLATLLRNEAAHWADVRYACPVASVDATAGFVRLQDGSCDGPYDMIIGADGRHSVARRGLAGAVEPRPYSWRAHLCLLDDAGGAAAGMLQQHCIGAAQYALWPVGRAHAGATRQLNLSWRDASSPPQPFSLERWRARVVACAPSLAPLLGSLSEPRQVLEVGYGRVATPCWGEGRVVLLGDAAHSMSPQLGQGASLALRDAQVLVSALAVCADVSALRRAYAAERAPRVRPTLELSRLLTPVYHASGALPRWLRETALPIAARLPVVRARMLRAMAGGEGGAPMRSAAHPAAAPVEA